MERGLPLFFRSLPVHHHHYHHQHHDREPPRDYYIYVNGDLGFIARNLILLLTERENTQLY